MYEEGDSSQRIHLLCCTSKNHHCFLRVGRKKRKSSYQSAINRWKEDLKCGVSISAATNRVFEKPQKAFTVYLTIKWLWLQSQWWDTLYIILYNSVGDHIYKSIKSLWKVGISGSLITSKMFIDISSSKKIALEFIYLILCYIWSGRVQV
jgi:hypothetical protein